MVLMALSKASAYILSGSSFLYSKGMLNEVSYMIKNLGAISLFLIMPENGFSLSDNKKFPAVRLWTILPWASLGYTSNWSLGNTLGTTLSSRSTTVLPLGEGSGDWPSKFSLMIGSPLRSMGSPTTERSSI